ncbi:MAG TPA: copper-binding protein [Blastocatellia bacterium]|jgi:protein SCO1/2
MSSLADLLKNRAFQITAALALIAAGLVIIAFTLMNRGARDRYELRGKVVDVDERSGTVTIAHEPIPGYMEAMTMPFKLKDPWPIKSGMAEGDRIAATLVVDGLSSWLEEVTFARESVEGASLAPPEKIPGMKPGEQVPNFALVNQDGKPISIHQYHGRALALTFIYTRCPLPDQCPLMTSNFAEVERALKTDPALYKSTHLLSVTVDPAYDTPEVLRNYAAPQVGNAGNQTFSHWEFATGDEEQVKHIAGYFGLWYHEESDQIVHNLITAIIAPDGKLVKFYHGNDWKPSEVVAELKNLKRPEATQARKETEANPKPVTDSAEVDKVYQATGVVESVNEERTVVQINHEEIKGLMPAMNMPFPVSNKSLLEKIAAGDRVSFDLMAKRDGFLVVGIRKQ